MGCVWLKKNLVHSSGKQTWADWGKSAKVSKRVEVFTISLTNLFFFVVFKELLLMNQWDSWCSANSSHTHTHTYVIHCFYEWRNGKSSLSISDRLCLRNNDRAAVLWPRVSHSSLQWGQSTSSLKPMNSDPLCLLFLPHVHSNRGVPHVNMPYLLRRRDPCPKNGADTGPRRPTMKSLVSEFLSLTKCQHVFLCVRFIHLPRALKEMTHAAPSPLWCQVPTTE